MQLPNVPLPPKPVFFSEEAPHNGEPRWREVVWSTTVGRTASDQLGSDGTLAEVAAATQTVAFHEPAEPDAPRGSVTFTSTPLAPDHVRMGHAELHLRASLSVQDASFYLQLIDFVEKGRNLVDQRSRELAKNSEVRTRRARAVCEGRHLASGARTRTLRCVRPRVGRLQSDSCVSPGASNGRFGRARAVTGRRRT
jgi:hypothetical protein